MRLGWLFLAVFVVAGVACTSASEPAPTSPGFLTLTEAEAIGLVQADLGNRRFQNVPCMFADIRAGEWVAERTDVPNTWGVIVRFESPAEVERMNLLRSAVAGVPTIPVPSQNLKDGQRNGWGPWTVFERTGAVTTASGVC